MGKFQDLTGEKFGHLTALKRVFIEGKKDTHWLCLCDCGNETITTTGHLKNGHTKSCGCLQRETMHEMLKTHGLTNNPLYKIYRGMIDRTQYPSNKRYKNYGGRGIKICDEWLNDFKAFYDWAIANGYKKGLTIDRIDVNGDYEPNNCRWVSTKVQSNNRTNNHYISYNGETHTMKEWSEILGIKYSTLSMRLNKYHWSVERAFGNVVL